jgi:hypothetical protein
MHACACAADQLLWACPQGVRSKQQKHDATNNLQAGVEQTVGRSALHTTFFTQGPGPSQAPWQCAGPVELPEPEPTRRKEQQ